jgi:hypothetical protein
VQAQTRELWLELCEQAANEQDPEKFRAIVQEISIALDLKKSRLGRRALQPVLTASGFVHCSLCHEPVALVSSKTDENGKAVHEECYLLRLRLKQATNLRKD